MPPLTTMSKDRLTTKNGVKNVTPDQRIGELNNLDHDVSQLLDIASRAVGLLSNEQYDQSNPNLEAVKQSFQGYNSDFFASLNNIEVRMRRQVYALEEAGLIAKGTAYDGNRATSMNEDQASRRAGGGALDSSWLNARAKDSVGEALREEVLNDAKAFLRENNIGRMDQTDDEMQIDPGEG